MAGAWLVCWVWCCPLCDAVNRVGEPGSCRGAASRVDPYDMLDDERVYIIRSTYELQV